MTYSTVWNKHTPTFGLRSYYGLKRLKLYYVHKFAHFKGLRLFFLSNFPEAMFIQEAMFTPNSRIGKTLTMAIIVCLYDFLLLVIQIFYKKHYLLAINRHDSFGCGVLSNLILCLLSLLLMIYFLAF